MATMLMRIVQLACFGFISLVLSHSTVGEQNAVEQAPGRIYVHAHMGTADQITADQIIAVDPESGQWSRIAGRGLAVRVSPNGQRIAFERDGRIGYCATDGSNNVRWLMDSTGRPVWSPDGRQILCSENEEGWDDPRFETWLISLDGTNEPQRTGVPETDLAFDWSPNGEWLVAASRRDVPKGMGWQLYVMHLDGSESRYLTRWGVNFHARFSPDGQQIAYVDSSRGKQRIKLVDIRGKNTKQIFQAPPIMKIDGLSWSPDGKRLAVSASDWHVRPDGSRVSPGPQRTDANYRLVIMGADGSNAQDIRVQNTVGTTIYLGVPHWR